MADSRVQDEVEFLAIYRSPQLLFEGTEDKKLRINKKFVDEVRSLKGKLLVVSVVGPCRTGKSFLLNRLAKACVKEIPAEEREKLKGFAIGSDVVAKTKGVWLWLRRHPNRKNCYVILLDTEGLGDPEKSDRQNDAWNFALATLLSCVLVYNSKSDINDHTLSTIGFIADIAKTIVSRGVNDDQFDIYFPRFVYAVRDFTLRLKDKDGEEITTDAYLENCLKLRGNDKNARKLEFNLVRQSIRYYFTSRKCFTLQYPTLDQDKLDILDELPDEQVSEKFLVQLQELINYTIMETPVKTSNTGQQFTGEMWADLATLFVEVVNEGHVPVLDQTLEAVYERQNKRAFDAAYNIFCEDMKALKLPATEEEFNKKKEEAMQKALKQFNAYAVYVEKDDRLTDVTMEFQKKLAELTSKNGEAWLEKCMFVLENLPSCKELTTKLEEGKYNEQGGFMQFIQDVQIIEDDFTSEENLDKNQMLIAMAQFKTRIMQEGNEIMKADAIKTRRYQKKIKEELEATKEATRKQYKEQMDNETKYAQSLYQDINQKKKVDSLEYRKSHLEEIIRSQVKNLEQLKKENDEEKVAILEKHIESLRDQKKSLDKCLQDQEKESREHEIKKSCTIL